MADKLYRIVGTKSLFTGTSFVARQVPVKFEVIQQ